MKRIAITQRLFWLQFFIVALSSWVLPSLPAHAEGSLQLVYNTTTNSYRSGKRPYLQFLPGTLLGGIQFSTTIKVYAQAGETLNLGSSAVNVGITGDIKVRAPGVLPNSPAEISCKTAQPGTGLINSLARELAGPFHPTQNSNPNAYNPCVIAVNQTGEWEIDFVSPNSGNIASPPNTDTNAVWSQPLNAPYVAAWDVTVRNSSGVAIPGRAFTNSLAMITGGNDRAVHSEMFVQTTDGYRYRVDLNGLDPNGFVFFANNKGFLEASTRNPLYRSVNLSATFGLPPGVTLHLPTTANNPATGDFTHQIFFNPPDTAVLIDTLDTGDINNFRFEGSEGNTLGQAGTSPLGGSFKFTPPSTGTAVLNIDANGNNIFNEPEDVQLTQYVGGGVEAQIFWDGRDGVGNVVPPRNIPYRVQLTFPFGEVHFPLIDPENDSNGIIIERLPSSDFTLYFNDDTTTIAPGPINAGQNNSSSAPRPHAFSNLFGDLKGIDRWTFFTPPAVELEGGIVIAAADLNITKTRTPDPAIAGGNITYTITVTNAGPSNITTASPAIVSDIFTENDGAVTNLSWTCNIIQPDNPPAGAEEGTCIDESGIGNLTDAELALDAGFSAQYTLTGTIIPTAVETIENQATVTRPNDVADPFNNDTDQNNDNNRTETATVTVPLTSGNPLLGVAKQLNTVVNNGDGTYDATYTIRVENVGNLDILNLQVTEDLFGTAESTFNSAVAAPQIVTAPQIVAGTLTGVNPDFNGNGDKNLLLGSETLPVGESIDITFTVRVTPGSQLGPYENTATATGTSPGGTVVSDDSTDDENLNPDTNNDGDPTNDSTPTAVTFGEVPLIGVAKAVGTPTDNGDRTFTIPYTLVVRNYGDVPLNTVQVTENLNETFADITYTLEPNSLSSPTLTVNPSFDGDTDINLLEADNSNNTLAVDTEATINFAVRVTPGNNLGPFNNQVTASGVTPGGTGVNDLSTNGSNPDGNNTGNPTDSDEITSVTLRGNPNLELEKRITRVNGIDVGQSENLADWPDNFVRGLAASNTIQPGDEVEYTIYFLSAGSGPLENAMVCDPLQDFQTFRTDTFNGQTPIEGTFGAEVGIALALHSPTPNLLLPNPDVPTAYLRSANSASNRGRFYPAGTATPLICEQNVRGAVVVDIGNLGVGDYGFIRFRVTID